MHERPTELLTDAYSEDEYYTDLLRVTGGQTTEPLARLTIQESFGCPPWMQARGVRFQPPLRGTLHLGRTNAFFLGGGKALVNSYYAHAAAIGVRILYDASVVDLDIVDGHFRAVDLLVNGTPAQLTAKSVVVASGGFESNIEWLKDAWGPAAENFIIRGTPYNTGVVLKRLLERGAKRIGDARTLRLLYLLSVADARASGPNVWSQWKAQLMRAFYQRLLAVLAAEAPDTALPTVDSVALALRDRFPETVVRAHLAGMGPDYLISTAPDRKSTRLNSSHT